MSKQKLEGYKNGIITIEAQSLNLNKFINNLWKNGIEVSHMRKTSLTSMVIDVNLSDYNRIREVSSKTRTSIRVIDRRGISFFIMKMKNRTALVAGIIVFIGLVYYLSTFIWAIDIEADKSLTPFELRKQVTSLGIKPGLRINQVNVYEIENKLVEKNPNIMWVRVRFEGARLKISTVERQSPPNLVTDDTPCDLVAGRDGEVVRVYTEAGVAQVKKGDIVNRGQVLVKGEQGNEGSTYQVHSSGQVICKTYYEEMTDVQVKGTKKVRTGKHLTQIFILSGNNKLYLKKGVNKFDKYDTIINKKGPLCVEKIYEIREEPYELNQENEITKTQNVLREKVMLHMDKSAKVVGEILDAQPEGDNFKVRVVLIAEENIAVPQKIQ